MTSPPVPATRPDVAPRKLDRREVDRASYALGRAFYDDPMMMYFMPSDAKRTDVMTYVMRCAVRMAFPEGESYTVDTADNGAALFLPPGVSTVPLGRVLRTILPEAWRFGLGPIGRYLAVMKELEAKHPAGDHWYLATLGVEPDRQGLGLGGFMISAILKRAEAEGTTVYLETNKARNVVFYQKHGFRIDDHFNCHAGRGPETWTMVRQGGQFHS
jgi:GNAT superfamily N-acetyltransferase